MTVEAPNRLGVAIKGVVPLHSLHTIQEEKKPLKNVVLGVLCRVGRVWSEASGVVQASERSRVFSLLPPAFVSTPGKQA